MTNPFEAIIALLTVMKHRPRGRGGDEDEGEGGVRASRLRSAKPIIRTKSPIASPDALVA
jgi:hypothetical protein